ncbi:MAG: AAA family ATPase [Myxococcota bacterium]
MARFFESITLTNLLSFGPEPTELELADVNVVVGPNGAGKSNLLEALNLLHHAPKGLGRPLREGGGVRECLWQRRGGASDAPQPIATIEARIAAGRVGESTTRYRVSFTAQAGRLSIVDESLEDVAVGGEVYFGYVNGEPSVSAGAGVLLPLQSSDPSKSILAQLQDPRSYPELTRLGEQLEEIGVYRYWVGGPRSPLRSACRADVPTRRLSEFLDNLPARLAVLKRDPGVKGAIRAKLEEVSPGFDDIEVSPEGGVLQLYLQDGSRVISSHRLSDGTLRYLMLLAILLDPSPPPLILIEEPELSLHPDVLPVLRDLLLDAGRRSQVVVTTQSAAFLDAWTDHASAVVVCERREGVTSLFRVDPAQFADDGVGLGTRWMRGEIGRQLGR